MDQRRGLSSLRAHRERGGALVELAVVMPLLIILALGVIEGAWAYSQQHAVRSMAREGARVAASYPGDTPGLFAAICDADDIVGNASLEAKGIDSPYERGARGFFEVSVTYQPITRFIPAFNSVTLTERVAFNSEMIDEPLWWSPGGGGATC